MLVYDADAHIEESPETFSDKYLDPAFRSNRPQVIAYGGRPHWVVDYQVFPRFRGPGAQSLGTPVRVDDIRSVYTQLKPEPIESLELSDPAARLRDMDAEGIDLQVLYPDLFLTYPLSPDPVYAAGLCTSYNRWLADATSSQRERLKWAAVVSLEDVGLAVQEVRRAQALGAVAIMVPGTAGDKLLGHPSLLPFFEEAASQDLPIGVHVLWSSPALNGLVDDLYYSTLIPFVFPVLLGFISIVGSGLLDKLPTLRVAFLEAGCLWIHFLQDRMDHRFEYTYKMRDRGLPIAVPGAKERALDYIRRGNVYFSPEVEDKLLPQVIELVGSRQLLFASDMPHTDRERFSAEILRNRPDVSSADAACILHENTKRFYGL
jgi:predicted TIM-barrel fold metal-dependent hydrolase